MLFRFGPEDLHAMRILVVEDEYMVAADVAEALRARGAEVIGPVATLAEAIRAVETNWIDRAVLDLDLGGEMSFPIADRLEAAGIPYVIATGCARESLPERFRAKPRLDKPFRVETLAGMMASPRELPRPSPA
jgi:DNA-binding response OmpR family regulator